MDRWTPIAAAALRERRRLEPAEAAEAPAAALPLVERLLQSRGYDVCRYTAASPLLAGGWAALHPTAQIAACDRDLSPQRQAFALAHELGHLVLHAAAAELGHTPCSIVDEVGLDDGRYGSLEIYNPRQRREQEANVFARHLLLPRDLLRRLFVRDRLDARRIAAQLGLSHAVTLHALAGLLEPVRNEREQQPSAAGRLDSSQTAAAEASERTVLVRAGPGTGKTSTLAGRLRFLLQQKHVQPERIAVITFSNRAVDELRARVEQQFAVQAGTITICTFHAFAHELLRRYAGHAGLPQDFQVLDTSTLLTMLRRSIDDGLPPNLLDSISLERPLHGLGRLLEATARLKDELLDVAAFKRLLVAPAPAAVLTRDQREDAASTWGEELLAFYEWYEQRKAAAGVLDYGDLLQHTVRLLSDRPDICEEVRLQVRHVLVDEYQDVNRAAARLLQLLAVGGNHPSALWAVGDAHQSIYRWRGAAPAALADALYSAGGEPPLITTLNINYRSVGPIVRLCGAVAAALDGRDPVDGRSTWTGERGDPPANQLCVTVADAAHGTAELAGIAAEIRREISAGRTLEDHAVLCATNAQADSVAATLRTAGIAVRRIVDPADDVQVRRALCLLDVAYGEARSLLGLVARAGDRGIDEETAAAIARQALQLGRPPLDILANPPASLNPEQRAAAQGLARHIATLPGVRRSRASATPRSERAWEPLAAYFFDAPFSAARTILSGPDCESSGYLPVAALLSCAQQYDSGPASLRAETFPRHVRQLLETGEGIGTSGAGAALVGPGVRVLTVHAAKGLEFPVVFIPNLAGDRFPGRGRSTSMLPAGVLSTDEAEARKLDARCLFFVAISRARDRLVLSRAERYGSRTQSPAEHEMVALIASALAHEPPHHVRWDHDPSEPPGVGTAENGPEPAVAPGEPAHPDHGVAVDVRALETFLACPRRYWYAHVLDLQGLGDAGSAHFQRTLRRTLSRIQAEGSADRVVSVLEEEWRSDHAPFAHEHLYLQRARRLIEQAIAGGVPDPERDASYGVECSVGLPNGSIQLSLDRLEHDQRGRQVAVRFRTGRPRPDHHSDTRSALYAAALRSRGAEGTVLQQYLATGAAREGRARAATLESRLTEVNEALRRIARAEFSATTGDHCDFCAFRLVCSRQ